MNSPSELQKRALWLLEQLPVEVLQRIVNLLESFYQELNPAVSQTSFSKPYDFSDLAGHLQWQGDAVIAQRKLRDEWE
jgi:hypothetical protein